MLKYNQDYRATFIALGELLRELRYDQLIRQLKGGDYYLDGQFSGNHNAIYAHLMLASARHAVAYRLFAAQLEVAKEDINLLLPPEIFTTLIDVGLLVENNQRVGLNNYTIIPWLGYLFIAANEILEPGATINQESYQLGYELLHQDNVDKVLDLNCRAGFNTVVASRFAQQITIYPQTEAALNLTYINLALNNIDKPIKVIDHLDQIKEESYDLIFTVESTLPVPAEFTALASEKEDALIKDALENIKNYLPHLIQQSATLRAIVRTFGTAELPQLVQWLQNDQNINTAQRDISIIIYQRSSFNSSYFQAIAQLLALRSKIKGLDAELDIDKVNAQLVAYYQQIDAQCSYTMLITIKPAEKFSLDIVNLNSTKTGKEPIVLPDALTFEEVKQPLLINEQNNIVVAIDQIEVTIARLIMEEKFLVMEIAEEVANQHHIKYETAIAKTLEFAQRLSMQGLMEGQLFAQMRGQMRKMQINVGKFANRLTEMSKEMESEQS